MRRRHNRGHHHNNKHHRHEKLGLIDAIKKFGFKNAIAYRIRKSRIPIWFWLAIIVLFLIPIIMVKYYIDFLAIIFYLLEIIVLGYLMFLLIKKFDRIRIHNDMRLFGLRILSGIISGIGAYMAITFLMFGMPIIMMSGIGNIETVRSMYGFLGFGYFVDVFTFGFDFNLPYTGIILYMAIMLGMTLIGGYLFFKFQRRTGKFVWFR